MHGIFGQLAKNLQSLFSPIFTPPFLRFFVVDVEQNLFHIIPAVLYFISLVKHRI